MTDVSDIPFRSADFDRRLLAPKINALRMEMQERILEAEGKIKFEAAQRRNPSSYLEPFLDFHKSLADECAERLYAIYCEAWGLQNQLISSGFIRALRGPILTMFAGKKSSVRQQAVAAGVRTAKPPNSAAIAKWDRSMDRLAHHWSQKLEAEAVACEYRNAKRREMPLLNPEQKGLKAEPRTVTTNEKIAQPGAAGSATWDDIEIWFLSDERVQIRNGNQNETRNYEEFRFADHRNGQPSMAWEFLRALAKERGAIRDGKAAGQPWHKVEKRIQEIRKVFRAHFRITTDPIPFVEGVGYQTRFRIGCRPSFDS